ncbi:hypothetical protein HYH38_08235 [Clostridium botulinum]|uniref:hypothetical protein n=1 Tax=Clostridium botulinum TaxID=1491 RepID=UPI001966F510|nr:hypothetical protein [Clostridium botulinum]MBN1071499.1 hypothetical protein [Clostridium botulinum]MBY6816478.1 hypothetical protein [Clostridium botulinum]MBY6827267.1 hypothetical protein [Clostridium botulinum]MBY6859215.1 hypothetical protein [Clostridium botulinum]MBY7041501.1 hypothetical protein [Clostridium botulinum]
MNIKKYLNKKQGQAIKLKKTNGGVSMLTLSQIREKNKTSTSLLQVNAMNQEYSNELINQCREEFETFVKPIRNKVVKRLLGEKQNEV